MTGFSCPRTIRRTAALSPGSRPAPASMTGISCARCTRSMTRRCIRSGTTPVDGMRSRRHAVRPSPASRDGSITRRLCWRSSMGPSVRGCDDVGRSASPHTSFWIGARAPPSMYRLRSAEHFRPGSAAPRYSNSGSACSMSMPACTSAGSCTATSIRETSSSIATTVSRCSISPSRYASVRRTPASLARACRSTTSRSWPVRCSTGSHPRPHPRRESSSHSVHCSICCSQAITTRISSSIEMRFSRRSVMAPCCRSPPVASSHGRRPRRLSRER